MGKIRIAPMNNQMKWTGVIPAITTPFNPDHSVDLEFLKRHCQWLVENGCSGIVALGSLGEGQALRVAEKRAILRACVEAIGHRVPVVAGISALSTAEAVEIAQLAYDEQCNGLMVLPPYVYVGDWREMKAHVSTVLKATELSCMLYNNPIAYKVDFIPAQIKELLDEHANLQAIKESSADVRRIAALREIVEPGRLQILVGVDDLILEAMAMGAVGWIAGLANAFARESVELFELARRQEWDRAFALYQWFLPLLRMDTVPKFVQLIKLVQQEVGMGSSRVRAPRLELSENERAEVQRTVQKALQSKPAALSAGVS
jgi:1-pyrroline-4-hydroxy-2-carboxylate deaminase